MSIESTTAEVVADTDQTFAEELGRLEDQLGRLAGWAKKHDRADHGDLLDIATEMVRTARRITDE